MRGFYGNLLAEMSVLVVLLQRRTRERLMNVLSLCGPESGIPKNPSVRLLSYSKALEKVSLKYCRYYCAVCVSCRFPLTGYNLIFPAH